MGSVRFFLFLAVIAFLASCTTPERVVLVPTAIAITQPTEIATATPLLLTPTTAAPTTTPRPRITPVIPTTMALPLDQKWLLDDNSYDCGYDLYADAGDRGRVILGEQMRGYAPRFHASPLLITCDPGDETVYHLLDMEAGTTLTFASSPIDTYEFFPFAASPDGAAIAFYGTPRDGYFDPDITYFGFYQMDIANGEIATFFSPPLHEDGSGAFPWDGVYPLLWREDGFYYATFYSASSEIWRATEVDGEVRSEHVFGGLYSEDRTFEFVFSTSTSFVAYAKADKTGLAELHLLNVETGADRIMDSGHGYFSLAFTPDGSQLLYRRADEVASVLGGNGAYFKELVTYNIQDGTSVVDGEDTLLPQHEFADYNVSSNQPNTTIIYRPTQ